MHLNDKYASDGKLISDLFTEHFGSVFSNNKLKDSSNIIDHHYIISNIDITLEDIKKAVKNLKINSSPRY